MNFFLFLRNGAAKNYMFLAVAVFISFHQSIDVLAQTNLVLDYERGTRLDLGQTISIDTSNAKIIVGSFQYFLPFVKDGRSVAVSRIYPLDVFDYHGNIQYSYLDTLANIDGVSAADGCTWCSWGVEGYFPGDPAPAYTSAIRCITATGDTLGRRRVYPTIDPDSLYAPRWNNDYGDIAIDDTLVVAAVRDSRRLSDEIGIELNRYVMVSNSALSRFDSFAMHEVVPGVPFLADRLNVSAKDSLIGLIGFTENRFGRAGDSIAFQIVSLDGELLNQITFDNVGRYSNETNSFFSAPSIEIMSSDGFIVAYPRFDSTLDRNILNADNIVTAIAKYPMLSYIPDWVYYPRYDSSENYRIRGVKYDKVKNRVLFFGVVSKPLSFQNPERYKFGFISALDPLTGELLWERHIDPRSQGNQQGTHPEVEYTLQILNDISLEDSTSIFIVGSVNSDPSTAFLEGQLPSENENIWAAQLDRNGCFNGDCGDASNNQVFVTSIFETPIRPTIQDELFSLFPSPVGNGNSLTISWTSERTMPTEEIEIFNSKGQLLKNVSGVGTIRTIPIEHFASGSYFLRWGKSTMPFFVE